MTKLLNLTASADTLHVKRTYYQIITLGMLLHLSMAFIFYFVQCNLSSLYNMISVLFYAAMLLAIHNKMFRLAVTSIHVEVSIFVVVNTLLSGWDMGFPLFLIAISSLVYFCPFRNKYVPYLFAGAEMIIFCVLRVYTRYATPYYTHVPRNTTTVLYLYSAIACFGIMLFAAFAANLSATVTQRILEHENRTLSVLADYDSLTGLLGRRSFLSRVDRQTTHATVALALGDIDDFKIINDTYGHTAGDSILREVAMLIKRSCEPHAEVCRWGGEEFVFFFTPAANAVSILNQLLADIEAHPFYCQDKLIHITMTIGISVGSCNDDVHALIDEADARMYVGKTRGKNQLVWEGSSPSLSSATRE